MSHPRRVIAAAVPLAYLLVVGTGTALAATGNVKMIESNERYAFSPKTIAVHVGDTVKWTNTSDASHTVTADSGGTIDSPTIAEGKTFTMTFDTAGTITYHCTIHSYMHGTIDVLAAGATPPATDTAVVGSNANGSNDVGAVLVALAGLVGAGVAGRLLARVGNRP